MGESALSEHLESQLRTVLLAIALVLGASVAVYWALIRRWTSGRQWVAFSDWAASANFTLRRAAQMPIPPALLAARTPIHPKIGFTGPQTRILQAESTDDASAHATRWNLLSREIESEWPATGLRPVAAESSLLDLYGLESFPVLGAGERFLVCGVDKSLARVLAKSSIRGLLPADVGLMLHGRELVLDFSSRPFDEIEFGRMLALADQLVTNLPAAAAAAR